MEQFLIVVGDISQGFAFVGPFTNIPDAVGYATAANYKDSWIICKLLQPDIDD